MNGSILGSICGRRDIFQHVRTNLIDMIEEYIIANGKDFQNFYLLHKVFRTPTAVPTV